MVNKNVTYIGKLVMTKKQKKAQRMLEKISLFKAAGFTDEQINKYFGSVQREKAIQKAKLKDKPLARIYKGLNTNAM
jgi:hypothetical protein